MGKVHIAKFRFMTSKLNINFLTKWYTGKSSRYFPNTFSRMSEYHADTFKRRLISAQKTCISDTAGVKGHHSILGAQSVLSAGIVSTPTVPFTFSWGFFPTVEVLRVQEIFKIIIGKEAKQVRKANCVFLNNHIVIRYRIQFPPQVFSILIW